MSLRGFVRIAHQTVKIFSESMWAKMKGITKEEAVEAVEELATEIAKEKLKSAIEEKIQGIIDRGLFSAKEEDTITSLEETAYKTPRVADVIKPTVESTVKKLVAAGQEKKEEEKEEEKDDGVFWNGIASALTGAVLARILIGDGGAFPGGPAGGAAGGGGDVAEAEHQQQI